MSNVIIKDGGGIRLGGGSVTLTDEKHIVCIMTKEGLVTQCSQCKHYVNKPEACELNIGTPVNGVIKIMCSDFESKETL